MSSRKKKKKGIWLFGQSMDSLPNHFQRMEHGCHSYSVHRIWIEAEESQSTFLLHWCHSRPGFYLERTKKKKSVGFCFVVVICFLEAGGGGGKGLWGACFGPDLCFFFYLLPSCNHDYFFMFFRGLVHSRIWPLCSHLKQAKMNRFFLRCCIFVGGRGKKNANGFFFKNSHNWFRFGVV